MTRTMWILITLLAVLSIATIWRDQSGLPTPEYKMCKEALFIQIFTGACTLRFEGKKEPS